MDFTSHDITVIEQALRLAIEAASKGSEARLHDYREVLAKLRNKSAEAIRMNGDRLIVSDDGLRFDYDDASDLN